MAKVMFAACLAVAVLSAGVGTSRVQAKPSSKEKSPEFITHGSEAGRYSVRVPLRMSSPEVREYATASGALRITTERCDVGRDLSLSVTWCDYPESFESLDAAELLDAVRDGLRGKDGVVRREVSFRDGGVVGREYRIEAGRNVVRARVALDGRRLYQLLIVGNAERTALPLADVFFQSFELRK